MTLRGRNRFPHISYYKSNTIEVSSPIACVCGDCLWEVRGLTVCGLTVRGLTVRGLTMCGLTARGLTVRDLTVRGLTVRDLTVCGLTVRDLTCAIWLCAVWLCAIWLCAIWLCAIWLCAIWLFSQSSSRRNAIPVVPVEVINISNSIRHYSSEMRHCVLANCVTHTTANYCRRRRFSGLVTSNIGCLVFTITN